MSKLKIYLGIWISFLIVITLLSLIRVRPTYVIYGVNGCAPELIQVTNYNVRVDTTYLLSDRTWDIILHEIGGCEFESSKANSKKFKLKVPLIMLLDYRSHFGGSNSLGRYLFVEFKLFGFIKQFAFFDPSKSIYFRDLPDRITEKEELIRKYYGESCLMKAKFIDCE